MQGVTAFVKSERALAGVKSGKKNVQDKGWGAFHIWKKCIIILHEDILSGAVGEIGC